MTFNQRIKELRGTRTMQDFGKLIDTKVSTISAWENSGTLPSLPKLIEVAKLLHVSSDYLLGLSDDKSYINYSNDFNSIKYIDLLNNAYEILKQPTGLLGYKLDKAHDSQNLDRDNHYPVDMNTIFNYTTEPTNTLMIAKARTGVALTYLTPLIKLLTKSQSKPNIVSWFSTPEEAIEFAKLQGYKNLHFTNHYKGFMKSNSFNILINMANSTQTTVYAIMKILFETAQDHELVILTDAYLTYRKNVEIENMSFKHFIKYVLKNTSISKVYGNELTLWANQESVQYMDRDKTNYLDYNRPLFVDFSIMNCKNPINYAILKLLQYNWLETSTPTHYILEQSIVDLSNLITGLAKNQTTTVMATPQIAKDRNYILLDNCEIIINYVPENGNVHEFIKTKEDIVATANKYSIYKHQCNQLPDIYSKTF